MKKITPLVVVSLLFMQLIISQEITNSNSMEVLNGHSISCNTNGITRSNTFYRTFDPQEFGIFSAYHINTFQFGIEKLTGVPDEGYPVTISIYSYISDDDDDDDFPDEDDLKLRGSATEMLTNQSLTVHTANIAAVIPANEKFVVAIFVPSDVIADGGKGKVRFDIGANNAGESTPSFIMAEECSISSPTTFASQGRSDVHLVMNVVGTSNTAGLGNLELVNFSYYPNPVKDKLLMKANENITSIVLYNSLGQEIKKIRPFQLNAELDLTFLTTGTYFVKALVNDNIGSFMVVKN